MKQPSHFLLFYVKRVCLLDGCECFKQRLSNRKVQTFRLLFLPGDTELGEDSHFTQKVCLYLAFSLYVRISILRMRNSGRTVCGTRFALEPCVARS